MEPFNLWLLVNCLHISVVDVPKKFRLIFLVIDLLNCLCFTLNDTAFKVLTDRQAMPLFVIARAMSLKSWILRQHGPSIATDISALRSLSFHTCSHEHFTRTSFDSEVVQSAESFAKRSSRPTIFLIIFIHPFRLFIDLTFLIFTIWSSFCCMLIGEYYP